MTPNFQIRFTNHATGKVTRVTYIGSTPVSVPATPVSAPKGE